MMKIECAHGQVAQVINNYGGVSLPEPFESQLQAEFIKNTGITQSNRDARAHLEWLMHERGFHLHELRRAWRAGSLRWCQDMGQWRAQNRWLDLVWGWFGIAALAMLLAASLTLLVLRLPAGNAMFAGAAMSVLLYGGMAYFISVTSLIPQRTAAKVKRAYLTGNPPACSTD